MDVEEYLRLPNRPSHFELIFGFLRAMVRPLPQHLTLVERVRGPLADHLTSTRRGQALSGPLDVVLHEADRLVLRPPLVVVLTTGRAVVRNRTTVWGAPDIVVDVLTTATARRWRANKLRWYRNYGVRECWLLDTRRKKFEVLDFEAGTGAVPHVYSGRNSMRSPLLPTFCLEVGRLFR